jgi:ribose/xylose/arabinose/galactoside ABC-type transport system permease subunit
MSVQLDSPVSSSTQPGTASQSALASDHAPSNALKTRMRGLSHLMWPTVALVLLLLFNFAFTPGFFQISLQNGRLYGSLIDILNRGTPTVLLALGMTLVIGTGGIDLSVGAVMALVGATAACLIARPSDSPLSIIDVHGSLSLIVVGSLAIGLLAGMWNGVLVSYMRIQPIVATLILMVAGRGVAQLLTNGQIPTFDHPGFEYLGSGSMLMLPVPVIISAVSAVVILLLVRSTSLGLFIEAVGNNRRASRIAGVSAAGVTVFCYAVTGLLAGMAGLLVTSDIKAADVNNTGLYLELDAILAVAIGGTSLAGGRLYLVGSVIGAIAIQTLTTTILARGVPPEATLLAKAGVIVGLCLLQSDAFRSRITRLFGRKARIA